MRWLAAALLLTCAGCAAGGALQPGDHANLPDRSALGAPPKPPALPAWAPELTAVNGQAVGLSAWGPDEPRAIVLALHGYGGRGRPAFQAVAQVWAEQGIATLAPDQRGFGYNPSWGRWPGASGLIRDAQAYARQVRAAFPCTPFVVLGHSMGGGVALAAAPRLPADALILSAPAIWGGDALNPLHRMLAWTVAAALPEARFSGRGVVRIQASDNLEALRALARDPLYLAPPSAREIMGLVRITDRAAAAADSVALRALLLLGEKDQIVPNDTVAEVFARLPGDTQVIRYPEGWHLLFRDLQAPRVWADTARFVLETSAPEACTS
ncbi:MAG: alpha/beta fold hydrolase [Pseudomonadota bacterium]